MTALETIREDQALGAAWRRCEAALPKGAALSLEWQPKDGWYVADAQSVRNAEPGRTPTAALEALAERLESLR